MKSLCYLLLIILVSACQGLNDDQIPATLQAEMDQYAVEIAELRQSAQLERTAVAATVAAAETQTADYYSYNNVLLATVSAGQPEQQERVVVVGDGVMSLDMFDLSDGEMRFVQVGTAGFVRPDDRCFETHQTFFRTSNTDRIYLAGLALNLQSGTQLQVNWVYEGQVVHRSSWSAPSFAQGQCIAIELNASHTPLLPGNWSANLFINGQPANPAPFTIIQG